MSKSRKSARPPKPTSPVPATPRPADAPTKVAARPWYLYLIRCANGALYAGITNDVAARYAAHVAGRGAKYTRAFPPEALIGSKRYPDRAAASRAEHAIRQLRPAAKVAFVTPPRRRPAVR